VTGTLGTGRLVQRGADSRRKVLRGVARLAGTATALILLYALLPLEGRLWWLGWVFGLLVLVGLVPLAIRRLERMRSSERPLLDGAEGLLMFIMILVLGFSSVYLTMSHQGTQFNGLHTRLDAVYFTVTTLSTVGFGDITATGQWARAFVTLQIVLDFTFVAVTIRVLGNVTRRRIDEQSKTSGSPPSGDDGEPLVN